MPSNQPVPPRAAWNFASTRVPILRGASKCGARPGACSSGRAASASAPRLRRPCDIFIYKFRCALGFGFGLPGKKTPGGAGTHTGHYMYPVEGAQRHLRARARASCFPVHSFPRQRSRDPRARTLDKAHHPRRHVLASRGFSVGDASRADSVHGRCRVPSAAVAELACPAASHTR